MRILGQAKKPLRMKRLFTFGITIVLLIITNLRVIGQCSVDAGNDITVCVGMEGFSQSLGESLVIEGGTAPFIYAWSGSYSIGPLNFTASDMLNDTTIANPELLYPNDDSLAFTVSVTDFNGNTCSDDLVVYFCNIMMTLEDKQTSIMQGDTAQLYPGVFGNCEPLTFQWTPDYNISDPTIPNPVVWPDTTTYYAATAIDSAGCVMIDSPFTVFVNPLNTIELGINSSVQIFPNPMSDYIVVEFSGFSIDNLRMELYDAEGRVVRKANISGQRTEIQRGDLQSGLYIYRLLENNQPLGHGKLIIN